MALTSILDQIGQFIAGFGLDPAFTAIGVSFLIALYPPFKRGILDNRVEDLLGSINQGLLILSAGFMLSFYYQYGWIGLQDEIIGITGGFVLGTLVVTTITNLTNLKG